MRVYERARYYRANTGHREPSLLASTRARLSLVFTGSGLRWVCPGERKGLVSLFFEISRRGRVGTGWTACLFDSSGILFLIREEVIYIVLTNVSERRNWIVICDFFFIEKEIIVNLNCECAWERIWKELNRYMIEIVLLLLSIVCNYYRCIWEKDWFHFFFWSGGGMRIVEWTITVFRYSIRINFSRI